MKVICSIFVMLLYAAITSAQIDIRYNTPRIGDEIIKQQVEFKDPGRNGKDVIWDFGTLKKINEEYILNYSDAELINHVLFIGKDSILIPKDSRIIVGTEHNTAYYYQIKDDKMWTLGHENPVTWLHYTQPLLSGVYPSKYGDNYKDNYKGHGEYSNNILLETKGETGIEIDSYGMMILPTGDTLKNVLRMKTSQIIEQEPDEYSISKEATLHLLENYKWYSKGYRYPIFETIRNIDLKQDKEIFATAFFFPPQDHYYLDDDPGNLAILDSLWNFQSLEKEGKPNGNKVQLKYNYYPNPVETTLTIEYYLDKPTSLTINLYSLDGRSVKTINKPKRSEGLYYEHIGCSDLSQGTYILRIQTDANTITSDKIIKK